MKLLDPLRVATIIRDVAEAEVLPRFQSLRPDQLREKKPGQVVTDADVEAEGALTRLLTGMLPAAVVGEESVEDTPSLMNALSEDGPVWVIDPVDGTANFAQGRPRFAVVVALVIGGRTVMGWIHDPIPNRTIIAEAGQGAWMDGQRLTVMPEAALAQMSGSVKKQSSISRSVAQVARRGSAAHDYIDLVTSRLHFAHFSGLMPWDHAAGVLIHTEAGGHGALMDGNAYEPVPTEAALLLAPGQKSWLELKAILG